MSSSSHDSKPEAGHQIFDWVRSTGIRRPPDAWAGGVFASVAEKLGWDTALVRGLGVVAFVVFFSPTALFYGLGWLFLPDSHGRIHAQEALRGSYPSGLWGAGALTIIGAINVFTPNLAGPFAILLNLVIIGVVAWVLWLLVSNHGNGEDSSSSPSSSANEARARTKKKDAKRASEPTRDDGRPAWYPKEGPEREDPLTAGASVPASPRAHGKSWSSAAAPTQAGAKPAGSGTGPESKEQEDPFVREERRRRRMVSFGLLLLAIPLIAAAMWAATYIGLAATSAVLLGLAAVVILLSLMHLWSAVRGQRGRGGLLGVFTALMMLIFLFAPSANLHQGSNHIFGNYHTQSSSVNTMFANTTVDLRHLQFQEEDALDFSDVDVVSPQDSGIYQASGQINNAFANTTVILPDDVYLEIDPGVFLGSVNVRMGDWWDSESGISTNPRAHGPEESIGAVQLNITNAFGNVTVYDETTYEQVELGIEDEDEFLPSWPGVGEDELDD